MKNNFNKRLETYVNSLKVSKKDYGSLWNSMIKSFQINSDSALGQFRGYFPVKNYSLIWIILKPLMTLNYLIRKTFFYLADFNKKIIDYLSNLFIKVFRLNYSKFDIYDLRYIKAKSFLKSQKLKSDLYNVFNLKNNYNSCKSIYNFHYLNQNRLIYDEIVIVEVGAGLGNIPLLIANKYKKFTYYIIDLPEMIVHASRNIKKYVPDAQIILPNEEISINPEIEQKFIFRTNNNFNSLELNESVDLFINIESFAEMPVEVVNDYLKFAYKSLKIGGHIYSNNRESRILTNKIDKINCFYNYELDKFNLKDFNYCAFREYVYEKRKRNIQYLGSKIR